MRPSRGRPRNGRLRPNLRRSGIVPFVHTWRKAKGACSVFVFCSAGVSCWPITPPLKFVRCPLLVDPDMPRPRRPRLAPRQGRAPSRLSDYPVSCPPDREGRTNDALAPGNCFTIGPDVPVSFMVFRDRLVKRLSLILRHNLPFCSTDARPQRRQIEETLLRRTAGPVQRG